MSIQTVGWCNIIRSFLQSGLLVLVNHPKFNIFQDGALLCTTFWQILVSAGDNWVVYRYVQKGVRWRGLEDQNPCARARPRPSYYLIVMQGRVVLPWHCYGIPSKLHCMAPTFGGTDMARVASEELCLSVGYSRAWPIFRQGAQSGTFETDCYFQLQHLDAY